MHKDSRRGCRLSPRAWGFGDTLEVEFVSFSLNVQRLWLRSTLPGDHAVLKVEPFSSLHGGSVLVAFVGFTRLQQTITRPWAAWCKYISGRFA